MNEPTSDQPTPEPVRQRRRERPYRRRWTNPVSPLQAARFARREGAREVVQAIRKLCPGHAGRECKIDVSKMSDYENNARRPSVPHIETLCRYYQKSAEELGLINWRDTPTTDSSPLPGADHNQAPRPHDPSQSRLVLDWLRDSVISVTAAVVAALARCPVTLTEEDLHRIIGELLPGDLGPRKDHLGDDPADASPPVGPTAPPSHADPSGNGVTQPTDGMDTGATPPDTRPQADREPHPDAPERAEDHTPER